VLPTPGGPKVLIDSGANVDTKPVNLLQFALLGSIYAEQIVGIERPRVGLINVGAEPTKGSAMVQEAYQLLQQEPKINFAGNVEGRELFTAAADVLVCDGFTGNVIIKLTEGLAGTLMGMIKEEIGRNPWRMLGGLLVKPGLKGIARQMDYTRYGGAPLLGVKGVSLICHGSSKAVAIKHAVRVAAEAAEKDFLEKALAQLEATV
jgi:glycerol-3-phosphate acyltransferase PlsX